MLIFFSCNFYRNYQHAQQAYLACLSLAIADRDEVHGRGAQDTRDVRAGFHFLQGRACLAIFDRLALALLVVFCRL